MPPKKKAEQLKEEKKEAPSESLLASPLKCSFCDSLAIASDPVKGESVCYEHSFKWAKKVAPHDTTIYHEEHPPRSIKKGAEIPEGWTTEPGTLSVLWKNHADGKFYKVKK